MAHGGRFAVHRVVEHAELSTERLDDALQAQADAKHGHAETYGGLHQSGHAEIDGAPRTGVIGCGFNSLLRSIGTSVGASERWRAVTGIRGPDRSFDLWYV